MNQCKTMVSLMALFLSWRHFIGLCCDSSSSVSANFFDLICPLCRKPKPSKKTQQQQFCSPAAVWLKSAASYLHMQNAHRDTCALALSPSKSLFLSVWVAPFSNSNSGKRISLLRHICHSTNHLALRYPGALRCVWGGCVWGGKGSFSCVPPHSCF